MKQIVNYVLAFAILGAIIYLVETFKPEPEIITNIEVDTLYMKPDTIIHTETKYISAEPIIDTVYLKDSLKVQVAKIDTTLQDSSRLRISYFMEPINRFDIIADIKEKTIYKDKIITKLETITIKEQTPFYKNTWFYTTLATILLLLASLGG